MGKIKMITMKALRNRHRNENTKKVTQEVGEGKNKQMVKVRERKEKYVPFREWLRNNKKKALKDLTGDLTSGVIAVLNTG